MSTKRLLYFAFLGFFILPSNADAQDCSELLKHGIFDFSKTATEDDLATDYLNWLSSKDFYSKQEAAGGSGFIGITLPIDEIPIGIKLGGEGKGSSNTNWGKEFAKYLKNNKDSKKKFYTEFKRVNKDLIDGWKECIKTTFDKPGLHCWAVQTGNRSEIMLKIRVNPIALPYNGLKITDIIHSPNVKPVSDGFKGKKIAFDYNILFTRVGDDARKGANFTIDTDDPLYTSECSVDELTPEPIVKKHFPRSAIMPPRPRPIPLYVQSLASGYFLEMDGASKDTGARTTQGPRDTKQVWNFIRRIDAAKTTYWQIDFGGSHLCLQANPRTKQITQEKWVASDLQLWQFIPSETKRYYYIKSKGTGLFLRAVEDSQKPGSGIGLGVQDNRQVWRWLPQVSKTLGEDIMPVRGSD